MNKRFFNFGFYKEVLNQTKAIGIKGVAVMFILTVITAISTLSAHTMQNTVTVINSSNIASLQVIYLVFAPLLAFSMFGFLNKRNMSDFYHSLPYSRVSMYTSIIAAIMTWVAAMTAVTVATLFVILPFGGETMIIATGEIMMAALGILVSGLFVVSAVAVAMAVTGKVITNLAVACSIIFLPRLLISMGYKCLESILEVFTVRGVPEFLQTKSNIVANNLSVSFDIGILAEIEYTLADPLAIFCTFLAAVLYFGLAMLLFAKRKSEAADHIFSNKIVENICGIVIGAGICCVAANELLKGLLRGGVISVGFIVLLSVALAVYVIYKLVVLRSIKKTVKALPLFLICLAVGGAYAGVVTASYFSELSFVPKKTEVEAVYWLEDSEISYRGITYDEYVQNQIAEIAITDSNIKSILAEALADNVSNIKKYGGVTALGSDGNHYIEYIPKYIRYQTKSGTKTRLVYLTSEQYSKVYTKISEIDKVKKIYATLPNENKNSAFFTYMWGMNPIKLGSEDFELLKSEIAQNPIPQDEADGIFYLEYTIADGKYNGKSIHNIAISKQRTPKTLQVCYNLFYEKNKAESGNADLLKKYVKEVYNDSTYSSGIHVEVSRHGVANEENKTVDLSEENVNNIISWTEDRPIDASKNELVLYCEIVKDQKSYTFLLPINSDYEDKIKYEYYVEGPVAEGIVSN